jgi:hypothetical protein
MKAAYTRYGPPDLIEVDDLDKPVPRDNEWDFDPDALSLP